MYNCDLNEETKCSNELVEEEYNWESSLWKNNSILLIAPNFVILYFENKFLARKTDWKDEECWSLFKNKFVCDRIFEDRVALNKSLIKFCGWSPYIQLNLPRWAWFGVRFYKLYAWFNSSPNQDIELILVPVESF
jgi:hypothetical protein